MISNKERREVAARLREGQFNGACLVHKDDRAFDYFMELADAAGCGIGSGLENMSLANRLADLIEPEPERTVSLTEAVDAICGEMCGDGWDWHNRAEAVVKTVAEMCGAKVVGE